MVKIKPLSEVVDEIVKNICPTADPTKIRASIEEEICLHIFPVIDDVGHFLSTPHKYKRELTDFVDKVYRKQLTDTYNEWAEDKNAFGTCILMEIENSLHMNSDEAYDFFSKNIENVHKIIWDDFVNPIRQRIWNLPTVYVRGKEHTISSVLKVLQDNHQELNLLLQEVCKS